MARKLLYATTNSGKLMEVRRLFEAEGIPLLAPSDLGLALEVDEPGQTLEENATLKAQAYLAQVDSEIVVMGDDTGVEIDALDGEPGIHVRRWAGYPMTDEATIAMTLERLAGVPVGERGAQFRTVIAVGRADMPLALFDGTLRGTILEEADPLRIEGFPFESVFYVPAWSHLLGEIHRLPTAEKARYATHREHAIAAALPHIRRLLDGVD